MKKLLNLLIIFLVVYILNINIYAEQPDINGKAAILIDEATGMVLYEKNSTDKLYPASTTKIMTAILALENGDLNQIMTASKEAIEDIGPDGMNIDIKPAEQLKLADLLNAMLIRSANETANIIAENIAGNRQDFIDMMNSKAKDIGTQNTNFVNPCGAHNTDHYSTASDFAKIARYAMSIPKFREIVSRQSYNMSPTNMHSKWDTLVSTNKLLFRSSKYYSQVTGLKTGFTNPAGFNLVSSAMDDNGTELISVIFGENSQNDLYKDSQELLEYGFNNFNPQILAEQGSICKNVHVGEAASNETLELVYSSNLSCLLPTDKTMSDIRLVENLPQSINSSVNAGQILGSVEFYLGDQLLGKVNAAAAKSINIKPAESEKGSSKLISNKLLENVVTTFLIVAIIFMILRLSLQNISRSLKLKKQKNKEIF